MNEHQDAPAPPFKLTMSPNAGTSKARSLTPSPFMPSLSASLNTQPRLSLTNSLTVRSNKKRGIVEAGYAGSFQSHLQRKKGGRHVAYKSPSRESSSRQHASSARKASPQKTPTKRSATLKRNDTSGLTENRAKTYAIDETPILTRTRAKSCHNVSINVDDSVLRAPTTRQSSVSPVASISPSSSASMFQSTNDFTIRHPPASQNHPSSDPSSRNRNNRSTTSQQNNTDEKLNFSFKAFSFQPFKFPLKSVRMRIKAIYPTPSHAFTLTRSKMLYRNDQPFLKDISSCSTCFYNVCAIKEQYWEKQVDQQYTYLHSKPVYEWALEQSVCFWQSGKEERVFSRKWCFPKRPIQQIALSEEILLILCEHGKVYWVLLHETFPSRATYAGHYSDTPASGRWVISPVKKKRKEQAKSVPMTNLYNKYSAEKSTESSETIDDNHVEYKLFTATDEWNIHSIQDSVFEDEVVSIAAGSSHYVALDRRGIVYCWGSFMSDFSSKKVRSEEMHSAWDDSVLDPVNMDHPRKIQTLAGIPIKKIVCGSNFTFLLSRDLRLYAFGSNCSGACGFPSQITFVQEPHLVESCFELDQTTCPNYYEEVELNQVIKVWCGDSHSWIMRKDGRFFSAGLDACSQVSCSGGNPSLRAGRRTIDSTLDVSHGYHNNNCLFEFHEVNLNQFFDMKRKFGRVLKGLHFPILLRKASESDGTPTSPVSQMDHHFAKSLDVSSPHRSRNIKHKKHYRFEIACGTWSTVLCQIRVKKKKQS
uniref:Uncharacterized protein n=1 Tax=Percolomonas cosmopolitus TaxID=63605 RepID=A0A7S1PH25_9EUKA|mmetsp:Transcript_11241/g.42081  ORF Transcript_11241/g.42081 Transcript_11241/m.42081 type:complete len:759 (+) Transcript_11241:395-2671(+)